MKRDSIHSGRRPSGLCGAALLIAARLHEFGRSPKDIIKIVKVHESTLKKRLMEFGDTPSSALTLDEFMNVDLEEEQDPPSFKAARKKDKERLQKLMEEEADHFSDLQKQIEEELEQNVTKKRCRRGGATFKNNETKETERFIEESTMETVSKLLAEEVVDDPGSIPERGLGPDIASMGLATSLEDTSNAPQAAQEEQLIDLDLDLDGIDDDEIDSYIMTDKEFESKKVLWYRVNHDYLEEQRVKAERLQKEREEGKPEKKRKRTTKKKAIGPASSAGEAIEKILQEKKISTKINYDVLKSLTSVLTQNEPENIQEEDAASTSDSIKRRKMSSALNHLEVAGTSKRRTKLNASMGLPVVEDAPADAPKEREKADEDKTPKVPDEKLDEDDEDEGQPANASSNEMGMLQMLRQHRDDEDEFGYDYDEGDY